MSCSSNVCSANAGMQYLDAYYSIEQIYFQNLLGRSVNDYLRFFNDYYYQHTVVKEEVYWPEFDDTTLLDMDSWSEEEPEIPLMANYANE